MKKAIFIFLLLTGCGSQKLMTFLNSQGDAFANSVELGKKAKAIMFECDFDEDCCYENIGNLVRKECQNPEKFDMASPKECEKVFEIQLTEAYHQNKQIMGY